ncbi:hypothetical protein BFP97_10195 [Roseivirga sp. 4D4]|nr:hypothetical protein BFP97_10195 [Roseivirga sp. 4D4]
MSNSTFLSILFLFVCSLCHGQIIDKDYEQIGVVDRDYPGKDIPFYFFADDERDVVLIGYGFKPTTFTVFKLSSLERISMFKTKGHTTSVESYFSESESDIIYIKNSKGKTVSKVNFKTGEVTKTKCQLSPKGCDYFTEKNYTALWDEEFRFYYFFFKRYLFLVEQETVSAYKKVN